MSRFSFRHHVPTTPEAAWQVVADHQGMTEWLPTIRVELEQEGSPDSNGVGAVRALHAVGPVIRERITAFEPGKRLGYEAVSGVPARDYRGEVTLNRAGGGTAVTWTIEFSPLVPGSQFAIAGVIRLGSILLARRLRSLAPVQ